MVRVLVPLNPIKGPTDQTSFFSFVSIFFEFIKEDDIVGAPSIDQNPLNFIITNNDGHDESIIVWEFNSLKVLGWNLLSFEMLQIMAGGIDLPSSLSLSRVRVTSHSWSSYDIKDDAFNVVG